MVKYDYMYVTGTFQNTCHNIYSYEGHTPSISPDTNL